MSQLYQIRHVTRYRYETDISENVMEVRKCPINGENQRCLSFKIEIDPNATLFNFTDALGNTIHHFDIPQKHRQMTLTAESVVELRDARELPENLDAQAWETLDESEEAGENLDFLLPSPLVEPTEALRAYFQQVKPSSTECPLTFLRRVNERIFEDFDYVPLSTQVDSPLDQALKSKQGVCQDFAHIMVGLARLAKIPARYVSGYLFHRHADGDRSAEDASHAWLEACLPGLGWVGFDPTNNILAEDRHIVTCIGRDYRDVPPTRGVYRGQCASELSVAVQVHPADAPPEEDDFRRMDESDLAPEAWMQAVQQEAAAQQQQ